MCISFTNALRWGATALVFVAVVLTSSRSAEAMLCELEEPVQVEAAWNSPLQERPVTVAVAAVLEEKPTRQRCDSYGAIDCDLNQPEGEPPSPRPITAQRPLAALAPSDEPAFALQGCPLASTDEPGQARPGYHSDIFRPPRRS